jgi:hypothetical protein
MENALPFSSSLNISSIISSGSRFIPSPFSKALAEKGGYLTPQSASSLGYTFHTSST